MKFFVTGLAMAAFFSGCALGRSKQRMDIPVDPPFSVSQVPSAVNETPVMLLSQPVTDLKRPQIVEVYVLPGRGMNIYKIRGYIPGKGTVDLIRSDGLDDAEKKMLADPNEAFLNGGAILAPFANRIRGTLSEDAQSLEVKTPQGQKIELLPNWKGKGENSERVAIHGLIFDRKFITASSVTSDEASLSGVLENENFNNHWPSLSNIAVTATLQKNSFTLTVLAKNVGTEPLPMGIGWHPYFTIPSGERWQARLRIPASERVSVNNYNDEFPTGRIVPTQGTAFDFTPLQGRRLGQQSLDDCFTGLQRNSQDQAVAELVDPKGSYGVRIKAVSTGITAFQVFAPEGQPFIAIEPQFNLPDPFGTEWTESQHSTGMALLQPGETAQYVVQLELFTPKR
jgi:galactose mutarotase-like enzyme